VVITTINRREDTECEKTLGIGTEDGSGLFRRFRLLLGLLDNVSHAGREGLERFG
jgi:hypothetical protein